jgi:hypothetical protein
LSSGADRLGGGREGRNILAFDEIDARRAEGGGDRKRRQQGEARRLRNARKLRQTLGRAEPRQKQSRGERRAKILLKGGALDDYGRERGDQPQREGADAQPRRGALERAPT